MLWSNEIVLWPNLEVKVKQFVWYQAIQTTKINFSQLKFKETNLGVIGCWNNTLAFCGRMQLPFKGISGCVVSF